MATWIPFNQLTKVHLWQLDALFPADEILRIDRSTYIYELSISGGVMSRRKNDLPYRVRQFPFGLYHSDNLPKDFYFNNRADAWTQVKESAKQGHNTEVMTPSEYVFFNKDLSIRERISRSQEA